MTHFRAGNLQVQNVDHQVGQQIRFNFEDMNKEIERIRSNSEGLRLPTIKELRYLREMGELKVGNFASSSYWSSTPSDGELGNPDEGNFVLFFPFASYGVYSMENQIAHIRLVKDI